MHFSMYVCGMLSVCVRVRVRVRVCVCVCTETERGHIHSVSSLLVMHTDILAISRSYNKYNREKNHIELKRKLNFKKIAEILH